MKKIILNVLAVSSLCLFAACAGDDAEPTRGEMCAKGLNEDCLVGKWNLKSIQSKDGSQIWMDFGATPSTLEFTDDGKFHFIYTTGNFSQMANDGCGGTSTYGDWTIAGSTLNLKIGRTDCQTTGRSYTVVPTITESSLNFNTVIFHENDMNDALIKSNSTEYFTFVVGQ